MGKMNRGLRRIVNAVNRLRLKNKDFSLIASNCNGCLMLHDLGLRFNSPFVNLWIPADDYIRFLQNMEYYLGCGMHFVQEDGVPCPIGVLDDVKMYFVHDKTVEEVLEKWNRRVKRIDMDRLFIMFTDRDGCTMEHLRAFDALPYKNKVVFTHLPYPEICSSFYVRGYEDEPCVGELYTFRNKWSGFKRYDCFDYVTWFNRGIE